MLCWVGSAFCFCTNYYIATSCNKVNLRWRVLWWVAVENDCQAAFILHCNAAVLPMYGLLIYRSSMQCTAPQVHFLAVLQCSCWCTQKYDHCNSPQCRCSRVWTKHHISNTALSAVWMKFITQGDDVMNHTQMATLFLSPLCSSYLSNIICD